jgi:hypothetical protein
MHDKNKTGVKQKKQVESLQSLKKKTLKEDFRRNYKLGFKDR